MRLAVAKKDLLAKIVICSLVIVITLISVWYVQAQFNDRESKRDWLYVDIRDLESKLAGLNRKTLAFSKGVKIWEGFSEEKRALNGLRITKAQHILKNLEKRYKLTNVNIYVSKPESLENAGTTETVELVSSKVNISFRALTDAYVLAFIAALEKEMPGYVQINTFNMSRANLVTKEVLRQILDGKLPGLVNANLEFVWTDFHNISGKNTLNNDEMK